MRIPGRKEPAAAAASMYESPRLLRIRSRSRPSSFLAIISAAFPREHRMTGMTPEDGTINVLKRE